MSNIKFITGQDLKDLYYQVALLLIADKKVNETIVGLGLDMLYDPNPEREGVYLKVAELKIELCLAFGEHGMGKIWMHAPFVNGEGLTVYENNQAVKVDSIKFNLSKGADKIATDILSRWMPDFLRYLPLYLKTRDAAIERAQGIDETIKSASWLLGIEPRRDENSGKLRPDLRVPYNHSIKVPFTPIVQSPGEVTIHGHSWTCKLNEFHKVVAALNGFGAVLSSENVNYLKSLDTGKDLSTTLNNVLDTLRKQMPMGS